MSSPAWAFYERFEHRPLAEWQSGGVSRLLAVGDLLRLSGVQEGLRRALSQSVLYGPSDAPSQRPFGPSALASLRSLENILTRSDLCPVAPPVETLIRAGLADRGLQLATPRLSASETESLVLRWSANRVPPPVAAPLHQFDDEPDGAGLERRIWDHVQAFADGQLRAWVHPQASMGLLLDRIDDRRVDYVLCPPWAAPVVWEAHGVFDPHDRLKSRQLQDAKWQVFDQIAGKTSKSEVENQLVRLLPSEPRPKLEPGERFLIDAAWVASQVDLVLGWMLATGRWSPQAPRLSFHVAEEFVPVVAAAIASWLELIRALEVIWSLSRGDGLVTAGMSASETPREDADLQIAIDPTAPTYIGADESFGRGIYQIRRACFPVDLEAKGWAGSIDFSAGARPPAPPPESALLVVMQRLFAKPAFRPGQAKAIQSAVTCEDALILFPTGYGKSLVFQLAAFLVPGLTLIIEPFRALLDDQERNLQDNGIGRVASLHSGRPLHGAALRRKLKSAELIYVAAERMHVSEFIRLLVDLVRPKGLALFIVDEAHTVSQFGHSFRPAYLDLIERVDAICGRAGRLRPTTLALTATAAQRVVRDIQALLHIKGEPISLEEFTSNSFVRLNLSDEIVDLRIDTRDLEGESREEVDERRRASVREQVSAVLGKVPTGQGIVFCPTKKRFKPLSWQKRTVNEEGAQKSPWILGAPLFGARGIREQIDMIRGPGAAVGLYTGASDDDDDESAARMASDARDFSQGKLDVMVATSAFGTGVDLQSVRWTVHLGMPGGLEAFYQESGRAGRDGSSACSFLMVDWDSDDLLDAITIDVSDEDPITVLQKRLRSVERRGSLARQLGLLIGEAPPQAGQVELRDPVLEYDDEGKPRLTKRGKQQYAFKPSFPGWRWEIQHVDSPLQAAVMAADRGAPISFWCHTWWEDLVWKAIYRLATLGVIRHGFEHSLRKSDARTCFTIERCDDKETLAPETLISRVESEVARLTTIERARAATAVLQQHVQDSSTERVLKLCAAMLVKTVYRAVFETRVESLRSLVRYAKEPSLAQRREIIEDYFAPSDLKRRIFALCAQPATAEVLAEALAVAESQPRWRSAVFEVAASEFPGALVPQLLLAIGGIKAADAKDSARYLFALFSNETAALDTRSWCYGQVVERARRSGLLFKLLNSVAALMKDSPTHAELQVLVAQLEDADGESELCHLLVANFLNAAMETRE